MMLAWKTAACLAAGNTVVLKPAQVCKVFTVLLCQDLILSIKAKHQRLLLVTRAISTPLLKDRVCVSR